MKTTLPEATFAAIFPQPVVSGPYVFAPPTLLHLAAIDRLGCVLNAGQIGADAAIAAGFALSLDANTLEVYMTGPRDDFSRACSRWAAGQPACQLSDLRTGVVRAINAAYDAAVPGGEPDPTTGHPQPSDGPSR